MKILVRQPTLGGMREKPGTRMLTGQGLKPWPLPLGGSHGVLCSAFSRASAAQARPTSFSTSKDRSLQLTKHTSLFSVLSYCQYVMR